MQIIEVTGWAVRSAVIRLRRRDTPLEFVVYPMIHMANASFYAAVTARLRNAQVIVAEGVRRGVNGRRSVLASALTLSYRVLRFHRSAGLVEQDIDHAAFDSLVVNPDVDADEFRASWRRVRLVHRLLLWCVLPVVVVVRLLGGSWAIWSKATQVDDLPSDEDEELAAYSPELVEALLGRRDDRLLAALFRLHEDRGAEAIEVAVVYGAAHVPAIVHGLRTRYGYTVRFGDWLTVADLGHTAPVEPTSPQRTAPHRRWPASGSSRTACRPTAAAGPSPAESTASQEKEVVGLRRLATAQPDAFAPDLVRALTGWSGRLADQGRPTEALQAADEAVDAAEDLRDRLGGGHQRG